MPQTLDITAAGVMLRNGSMSASELLAKHLAAIDLYQSELNCYVCVDVSAAKQSAEASEQRFLNGRPLSAVDGIPIALKDNIDVQGMKTHNGTRLNFPFENEAMVAKKLRAGGAILVGKLNMDECALGATTNNSHYGRTHNPWKAGYIPGGSSGGAAAAVASGLAMAALGTDTLGSVRLPAAYCGIVGLKPTRDLVSTQGVVPLSPTLDHVGPLCRSVRDCALLLSLLADHPASNQPSEPTHLSDLAGIRIGILDQIQDVDLTEEIATAFNQMKTDLTDRGAILASVSPPNFDLANLQRAAFLIIEVEGANVLADPLKDHPECFSDEVKSMFAYGLSAPNEKIKSAQNYLDTLKTTTSCVFDTVDFLISPTAPQSAFAFDGPAPNNQASLTALANVCGWPALTLPFGLGSSGMPIAAQLTSSAYQENKLFGIGQLMEDSWGTISPNLSANT